MKHKSTAVIKYLSTADLKLFNEEFSTVSLVRLFQLLITPVLKKLTQYDY